MSTQAPLPRQAGFSVGICAADESAELADLAESVLTDAGASPGMRKLVIVASRCSEEAVARLRTLQQRDGRVDLLVEDSRRGKADAINKIIDRSDSSFLVLLNSDARPARGAIRSLLSWATADERIGAVSAVPVPRKGSGVVSLLSGLMWSAHNSSALALNHMNLSNHSSDELVLFRFDAMTRLPAGLVNDGAFLAGTARLKGYLVKVCPSARVEIKTPRRIADVVNQRRRILFGHVQVWRHVGKPPRTIESMLFLSPVRGVRLLGPAIIEEPKFLAVLPIALVTEVSAALLSIFDTIRASEAHSVWRRFS